jgi:ketosteroid isomerase-like protein
VADQNAPGLVVRSYWDAEQRRDIDAVLGHYHQDAVLVVPDLGRLVGHDQIKTFYAASIGRFPKLTVTIESELAEGQRGAFEWSSVFTDHAGRKWNSSGVNIIRVSDGKFASVHVYYDPAPLAES